MRQSVPTPAMIITESGGPEGCQFASWDLGIGKRSCWGVIRPYRKY